MIEALGKIAPLQDALMTEEANYEHFQQGHERGRSSLAVQI
jgi:hypothetical protein